MKSWQHRTWQMSYSKVDCRPEGYLSFPHPVCRESPALAREGPFGAMILWVMTASVWSSIV